LIVKSKEEVLEMAHSCAGGERARHGYEIAKLIEKKERSGSVLQFHVASLYPLLLTV